MIGGFWSLIKAVKIYRILICWPEVSLLRFPHIETVDKTSIWHNILLSWPMHVFSAHCTESDHPHSPLVKSSLLKSVWIKLSHVIYSFAHSKIQSLQRVFIYYTNSFTIRTGIYISISINCFLNGSFAWFMSTNSMGLSMHFSKDWDQCSEGTWVSWDLAT